jgi:lysophospholipase
MLKKIFFISLLCISWLTVFASEKSLYDYKITTEQQLKKEYIRVISPYFYKHKLHFFTSVDNIKIAYKIFKVSHALGAIVIVNGRTEGMIKYQELIYDLNRNGYDVYILDHRGQGYSGRLVADAQMGYVDNFFNYVDDLKFFVSNFVPKAKKRILLAHSMGGAIASLYVEHYKHDFDALILSSPMAEPNVLTPGMTPLICQELQKRKKNLKSYLMGTKSYDVLKYQFDENDLTHSKVRFEIMKKAYAKEPETRIGGASRKWLQEACKWSSISIKNAYKIEIPILLFQAQKDTAVTAKGEDAFCKKAAPFCKKIVVPGAYHELFIEKDPIRKRVLESILNFIAKI